MGDTGTPEQQLNSKPLKHLDALYPGTSFMLVTDKRDKSKSIVGTRRTVRNRPVYHELRLGNGIGEVKAAAAINVMLEVKCERDSLWGRGGIVTGFTPSLIGGQKNRKERRAGGDR